MSPRLHVSVQPRRQTVSRRAAAFVQEALRDATPRTPALLLLSGGSSVLDVCTELRRLDLPWPALHVGQLDERVAPVDHPERAWPGIESTLLAPVGDEVGGTYPIPVDGPDGDGGDPDGAAAAYNATLHRLAAEMSSIVAVCGLGSDGHVASVLAGDEEAGSHCRATTTGPYDGLYRVTVSMTFLRSLPHIVVVASGASKAEPMRRLVVGPRDLPAGHLPAHTRFVIDRQAATLMNR